MTLITIRIDSWMYSMPVCVCVNLEISGFSEETYERHSRNPRRDASWKHQRKYPDARRKD